MNTGEERPIHKIPSLAPLLFSLHEIVLRIKTVISVELGLSFMFQGETIISNNNVVGDSEKYRVTGNYTLHVLNVDNADSAIYSCGMVAVQGFQWKLTVYGQ